MAVLIWSLVALVIVASLVVSRVRTRRRHAHLAAHDVPNAAELTAAVQGRRRSGAEIEARGAMGNVPYGSSSGGPLF